MKGIDDDDVDVSDFQVKGNRRRAKVNGRGSGGKKVNKVKMNQYYRGVPIYGASIVVEYEEDDEEETDPFVDFGVYYEKSYLREYIQNVKSQFDDDDLREIIAEDLGRDDFTSTCEEWIYFVELVPYFSFMCDVIGEGGGGASIIPGGDDPESSVYHWEYVIDAKQGTVLNTVNRMNSVVTRADVAGNTKMGTETVSMDSTSSTGLANADVYVQTCNYGTTCSTLSCQSSTDCEAASKDRNGGQGTAMLAFQYAAGVFDCYRALTQGAKEPVTHQVPVRVHYSTNYENAFWNGDAITFGDGYNTFYPLVCADVMAHELAHGFTSQNSDLEYSGESGGMNEAYSDLAGVTCAAYIKETSVDWSVGADIFKTAGQALRYMNNPPADGVSIDNYANYNGQDVHYSSGVYNKAFYNMVQNGLTINEVFKVATYANEIYWSATSTMLEGAEGMEDAAQDLGVDSEAVVAAFAAVGIDVSATDTSSDTGDLTCDATRTGSITSGGSASITVDPGSAASIVLNGCASDFDTIFTVNRADGLGDDIINDDHSVCTGYQSYVAMDTVSGYTGKYTLVITGYGGDSGTYSVTMSCTIPTTPTLDHISIGWDGTMWGIDTSDNIYAYSESASSWSQIGGSLKQISVGSSSNVWGINVNNYIYYRNSGNTAWVQVSGGLKQVSVAYDGAVWGVNTNNNIYYRNSGNTAWVQVSGGLVQVSAGTAAMIWGVDTNGYIYKRNIASSSWTQVSGILSSVHVSRTGDVWGVNANGYTYRYSWESSSWSRQTELPLMAQVETNNGKLVGITAGGEVHTQDIDVHVFDYPACSPNCLVDNGGCPSGVACHQRNGAIYRVSSVCYQAISGCWGCLSNPTSYTAHLEQVTCPTSSSYASFQALQEPMNDAVRFRQPATGAAPSTVVGYNLMFLIGVLVVMNIACLLIYCYRPRGRGAVAAKYEAVRMQSEAESDAENNNLI
eukprot:CAMPEP_0197032744 /NCGR_PEP_ID=MMETSP1384-20130603/11337_1 /TAXON_ID=29189 /ORGANISM="Ammonia sp." /LENGTH=960 /DNA_ID=CAMNT_0042462447 /DNA_START=229 /DNA_END=3111 /DNA_ORIENTATION=-